MTCVYLILLVPLLNIRSIYTAIGQDDEVADYAATYVYYTVPFVYFYYLSTVYATFTSQQEVTWYGLATTVTGTVSHSLMILIFFVWLDLGYKGVMLATGLMFIFRFMANFLLTECRSEVRKHPDVYLFSKETVTNIWPLLRKSLASMLLSIWGWWAFDIFTLMATYIGATEAGSQTIMRSIGLLTFMMPAGFSGGCGILLGKSIG